MSDDGNTSGGVNVRHTFESELISRLDQMRRARVRELVGHARDDGAVQWGCFVLSHETKLVLGTMIGGAKRPTLFGDEVYWGAKDEYFVFWESPTGPNQSPWMSDTPIADLIKETFARDLQAAQDQYFIALSPVVKVTK